MILAAFRLQTWGAIYFVLILPPRLESKIGSKAPKNRLKLFTGIGSWMQPVVGSEVSEILNKNSEQECLPQCSSCLLSSMTAWFLWNLAKSGTCGCLGWTTLFCCCIGKYETDQVKRIQAHIKDNGWNSFTETTPLDGQRCIVIENQSR